MATQTESGGPVRNSRKKYSSRPQSQANTPKNSLQIESQYSSSARRESFGRRNSFSSSNGQFKKPYERPSERARKPTAQEETNSSGGILNFISNIWNSMFGKSDSNTKSTEREPKVQLISLDSQEDLIPRISSPENNFNSSLKRSMEEEHAPAFHFVPPVTTRQPPSHRSTLHSYTATRRVKSPFRPQERLLIPSNEYAFSSSNEHSTKRVRSAYQIDSESSRDIARRYLDDLVPSSPFLQALEHERSLVVQQPSYPKKETKDAATETEQVRAIPSPTSRVYGLPFKNNDNSQLEEPKSIWQPPFNVKHIEDDRISPIASPRIDLSCRPVKSASTSPLKETPSTDSFAKNDGQSEKNSPSTDGFSVKPLSADESKNKLEVHNFPISLKNISNVATESLGFNFKQPTCFNEKNVGSEKTDSSPFKMSMTSMSTTVVTSKNNLATAIENPENLAIAQDNNQDSDMSEDKETVSFGNSTTNTDSKNAKTPFSFSIKSETSSTSNTFVTPTFSKSNTEVTKPAFTFGNPISTNQTADQTKPVFSFGSSVSSQPSKLTSSLTSGSQNEKSTFEIESSSAQNNSQTPSFTFNQVSDKKYITAEEPNQTNLSTSSLVFGQALSATKDTKTQQSFSFGSQPSVQPEQKPSVQSSSFQLNGNNNSENTANAIAESARKPFSFGIKSETSPTSNAFVTPTVTKSSTEVTKPAFTFGNQISSNESADQTKPVFSFGSSLSSQPSKLTSSLFSSSQNEKSSFEIESSSAQSNSLTPSLSFSQAPPTTKDTKPQQSFSFGPQPSEQKPSVQPSSFQFGSPVPPNGSSAVFNSSASFGQTPGPTAFNAPTAFSFNTSGSASPIQNNSISSNSGFNFGSSSNPTIPQPPLTAHSSAGSFGASSAFNTSSTGFGQPQPNMQFQSSAPSQPENSGFSFGSNSHSVSNPPPQQPFGNQLNHFAFGQQPSAGVQEPSQGSAGGMFNIGAGAVGRRPVAQPKSRRRR